MKSVLSLPFLLSLVSVVTAAEPASSPAARGTLLFEDDFARDESKPDQEEIGRGWTTNSAWRAKGKKQVDLRDGAMYVTRVPEADHSVAIFHETPVFQDGAVQLRFKLGQGDNLCVDFVDRELMSVHAGHLCIVRIMLDGATLNDSKTGVMDNAIRERRLAKDKSPELAALVKSKTKDVPLHLAADEWHDLVVAVEGQEMSLMIDGKERGRFASEGMAHPTKRMITLSANKAAWVDDVKIWKLR